MSNSYDFENQSVTKQVVLGYPEGVVPNTPSLRTLRSSMKEKKTPTRLAEEINMFGNVGASIIVQEGSSIKYITNKFYMQGMHMNFKERVQVQETFGTPLASFFGESAKVYNFSGVALEHHTQGSDTGEYYHATSLMYLYNNHMRGTKLVENNQIAIMQIMNHYVWGYPIAMTFQANSDFDKVMQFSLSFLVKDHTSDIAGLIGKEDILRNIDVRKNSIKTASVEALETLGTAQHGLLTNILDTKDSLVRGELSKNVDQNVYEPTFDELLSNYRTSIDDGLNVTSNVGDFLKVLSIGAEEFTASGGDVTALLDDRETRIKTEWFKMWEPADEGLDLTELYNIQNAQKLINEKIMLQTMTT